MKSNKTGVGDPSRERASCIISPDQVNEHMDNTSGGDARMIWNAVWYNDALITAYLYGTPKGLLTATKRTKSNYFSIFTKSRLRPFNHRSY